MSIEKDAIKKLITATYDEYLSYFLRETKHLVSHAIIFEIIERYSKEKDNLEYHHKDGIKGGIDDFKKAGLLTYWICKLKPIFILEDFPTENIKYANEYLAIGIAWNLYYKRYKKFPKVTKKVVHDLVYTLRYRMISGRMLSLLYEHYCTAYKIGKEEAEQLFFQTTKTQ